MLAKYERCLNTQNILRAISLNDDTFVKINDQSGDQVRVYAKNRNLYLPECTETRICYKDTPIIFRLENKDKPTTGFLSSNNIVRKYST